MTNGVELTDKLDRAALQRALQAQGDAWYGLLTERCPHLFAAYPVLITAAQMRQMCEVIGAVERVVKLPGWDVHPRQAPLLNSLPQAGEEANVKSNFQSLGVFFGYDFHLNEQGAHLIEINSNAGGGFLNALLLDSQRDAGLPGKAIAVENLEQVFLDMFRNEWRLVHGDMPLRSIAIVDEQPEMQYLYPEFLLTKNLFERAGIAAHIVDPSALKARDGGLGLYLESSGSEQKIDLVYNRLTDFSLQRHPVLRQAYLDGSTVLTPDPAHYARYADKRNLARLTDADGLRALGVAETDIAVLQAGIPHTRLVGAADQEQWWAERKQWFFKPNAGYGSKGAYRGEKLTRRVFEEIMQGGYIAQKLASPGERTVCVNDAEPVALKYDVRCYVYDGHVQLVAARLYQGQTTNFRTPGGGFAPVRVVE
ncbi:MAG: hypothetical protein A2Z94_03500 [Gallionellales bacterium GWA2_55_18]|nr:MAG: hypothetical protein A2Z94_03500 [Gallionellales bacterium GWA2_55_18]